MPNADASPSTSSPSSQSSQSVLIKLGRLFFSFLFQNSSKYASIPLFHFCLSFLSIQYHYLCHNLLRYCDTLFGSQVFPPLTLDKLTTTADCTNSSPRRKRRLFLCIWSILQDSCQLYPTLLLQNCRIFPPASPRPTFPPLDSLLVYCLPSLFSQHPASSSAVFIKY